MLCSGHSKIPSWYTYTCGACTCNCHPHLKVSDAVIGQTEHINLVCLSSKTAETGGLHGICTRHTMATTIPTDVCRFL